MTDAFPEGCPSGTFECDFCAECVSTTWSFFVTPDPDLPDREGSWFSVCDGCRRILD